MKKWFCTSEGGLDAAVKMAAYAAGVLISKNNKALATAILPVAQGIKSTIDNGTDNAALNAILREAITELAGKVSDDPIIEGAVTQVLASLEIDIPAGTFPVLDNAVIKDLVGSFVAGMMAVIQG